MLGGVATFSVIISDQMLDIGASRALLFHLSYSFLQCS